MNGLNYSSTSDNSSDIHEATLYVTEPFNQNQILNLNKNYLNKLKVSLETVDSSNDDISYTSIFVKQSDESPDYYLSIMGIQSVHGTDQFKEYCKLEFREADMKGCYISSYLLANNLVRLYERKNWWIIKHDEIIFEGTIENLHGQALNFQYSKEI